jgi:hypothetical protein
MTKRLLLVSAMVGTLASTIGASADVILDTKLSGTGDNVIFNQLTPNLVIGSFNGQHTGFVFFHDLSLNPNFVGAQSGNDIKIANTTNLGFSVFQNINETGQLYTLTDVFSLKGTGSVTAFVTAVDQFGNVEPIKTFNLGTIDPSAQSGFTLTAINGELIKNIRLFDSGGNIADFEHYRIDVGTLAVPGPIAGAGLPGILAAMVGLWGWKRNRNRKQGVVA